MDQAVLQFVTDNRSRVGNDLALLLMHVGQSNVTALLLVATALAVTVRARQWTWGAAVCTAAVGATAVSIVAKAAIERPRPPIEHALVVAPGWSMPSSVGVLSAAMAVAAVWGWDRPTPKGHRTAVIVAASVVVTFGAAVVYLGVHWTSDVLVGWAVGAAIGAASIPVGRWIAERLRQLVPSAFDWVEQFSAAR